jgi:hypothetical protein
MMFASQNRNSAIRSGLPQNLVARDGPVGIVGLNASEDQSCCGGAPARRRRLAHLADLEESDGHDDITQSPAVISAHRKPASSRATAVATTERMFLRADRDRNLS